MLDPTVPAHSSAAVRAYTPADNPRFVALHRRFPTVAYLRRHARRRVPSFAFEYLDGGAGSDGGIARNWNALDAVELVPRYGVTTTLPSVDIELFGRRYSAPIGVAPMGGPSIVWPGADEYLAAAAQRARVPYALGLVGAMTVLVRVANPAHVDGVLLAILLGNVFAPLFDYAFVWRNARRRERRGG